MSIPKHTSGCDSIGTFYGIKALIQINTLLGSAGTVEGTAWLKEVGQWQGARKDQRQGGRE